MAFAHAATDGIGERHHIFHRMRDHVAQQQIIAEAIADLRHLTGRRRGMEAERHAKLFQRRPQAIEVARVPRKITQRLRPGAHLFVTGGQAAALRDGLQENGNDPAQSGVITDLAPVRDRRTGMAGAVFLKGSRRDQLETVLEPQTAGAP